MSATNDVPVPHACVVHLGFSGSRDLFPGIADPLRRTRFAAELTRLAAQKLAALAQRPELGLHAGHFLVGVGSMAAGADAVFADACEANGIALRVLLPQPREEFLAAKSSKPPHAPEFSPAQREQALQRLQRTGVVQEQAVATAADAARRLVQTGVEILQTADILLTLQAQHQDGVGKPGATNALAAQALADAKPVYALTFWIDEKQTLHLYDEWRAPAQGWQPPQLPVLLPAPALEAADFNGRLRETAERIAADNAQALLLPPLRSMHRYARLFAAAVAAVLLCALVPRPVSPIALAVALAVLSLLLIAQILQMRADGAWRVKRRTSSLLHDCTDAALVAELARTAQAVPPAPAPVPSAAGGAAPPELIHLSTVELSLAFRPLRCTLEALWLQAARATAQTDWERVRERYLAQALQQPEHGVVAQLQRRVCASAGELARWQRLRRIAGGAVTLAWLPLVPAFALLVATPGFSGIVLALLVLHLPAFGLENLLREVCRHATAEHDSASKSLQFVREQITRLQHADSPAAFAHRVQETEFGLLARRQAWYEALRR